MGTFISRLTEALEGRDNRNRGRREDRIVNVRDLEEILIHFDRMDTILRDQHIDADLRSEPTIINIPDGLEREEFIKTNPQALF